MIPSALIKVTYVGNGTTTEFPFTFKFASVDDIKVAISDGMITTVLTSDYLVDTTAGKVIYPGYATGQAPPASEQPEILPSTKKLIIYRETPLNQLVDLGDKYPLSTIEGMTDKNLMILQEMAEKIDRSVKVDMVSETTPDQLIARIYTAKDAAESSAASAATTLETVKSTAIAAITDIGTAKTTAVTEIDTVKDKAISDITPYVTAASTSATNAAASQTSAAVSEQKAYEYAQNPGIPVGFIFPTFATIAPVGSLPLLGGEYPRATYQTLYDQMIAEGRVITESTWQAKATAQDGNVAEFSSGDGSTTFRVPSVKCWIKGDIATNVGKYFANQNKSHNHATIIDPISGKTFYTLYENSDSASADNANLKNNNNGNIGNYHQRLLNGDLANEGGAEARPNTLAMLWCVKAFGAVTNVGSTDVSAIATGVEQVATRVTSLESNEGFTIIYPNGGTKEAPANVAVNSRYIVDNPFVGYEVGCIAEVYYNGQWGETGYAQFAVSSADYSYGIKASQFNSNKIIIQTGGTNLLYVHAKWTGHPFGELSDSVSNPLPCRVKVWKVGKIS